MKVLFVCKSNVGRSQMAEGFFNKFSKKNEAISAGVAVEERYLGKRLGDITIFVVPVMKEEGIDISDNRPKQLNEKVVDEVDKIIVMVERDLWPDYLKSEERAIFWGVDDPRKGDMDVHRKARDEIKMRVKKLVEEIG